MPWPEVWPSLTDCVAYLGIVAIVLAALRWLWNRFRGKSVRLLDACHFSRFGGGLFAKENSAYLFAELLVENRDKDDLIKDLTGQLQLGQQRHDGKLIRLYDVTKNKATLDDVVLSSLTTQLLPSTPLPMPMPKPSLHHFVAEFITSQVVPHESMDCVVKLGFSDKPVQKRGPSRWYSPKVKAR